MIKSFTFVFSNDANLEKIIKKSEAFFGLKYYQKNRKYANAIDIDKNIIINLYKKQMDIKILYDDKNILLKKIEEIKRFCLQAFKNQTIGIEYENDDETEYFKKINGVEFINLN